VLGLTVALSTNVFAEVVLVTNNGILMGANGVSVNNVLYDVTFEDGVYGDVVSPFISDVAASDASNALLTTVILVDYSLNPFTINGCHTTAGSCYIDTVYRPTTFPKIRYAFSMLNKVGTQDDVVVDLDEVADYDTTIDDVTLAKWSLSTNAAEPVPEPETYAMMFAGLGLLGFVSRRRKQKVAVANPALHHRSQRRR